MSDFSKPVLAIDSALGGCITAVLTPDGRSFPRVLETQRDQAAKMMPMVQELMGEAGVAFADLGLIVTTTGPGSFTGLRIGLSTARALGLSLDLPVQGVSTFDAMARSCLPEGDSIVVLETKREDFYVQVFDCNFKALQDPACLKSQEILAAATGKNLVLCGDASARLKNELGDGVFVALFSEVKEWALLDPVVLAQTGLEHFLKNGGKAAKPEPVYLRGADVSLSNKIQRQINNLPV